MTTIDNNILLVKTSIFESVNRTLFTAVGVSLALLASTHEGGMEVVPKHNYDIILANITTNVIKENLPHLLPLLKPGGHLLMSGILDNQEDQIVSLTEDLKLTKIGYKHKENWIALHYQK